MGLETCMTIFEPPETSLQLWDPSYRRDKTLEGQLSRHRQGCHRQEYDMLKPWQVESLVTWLSALCVQENHKVPFLVILRTFPQEFSWVLGAVGGGHHPPQAGLVFHLLLLWNTGYLLNCILHYISYIKRRYQSKHVMKIHIHICCSSGCRCRQLTSTLSLAVSI